MCVSGKNQILSNGWTKISKSANLFLALAQASCGWLSG